MQGTQLGELHPISRRANCKLVSMQQRVFMIGGVTGDTVTNSIFEVRLNNESPDKPMVEWREVNFQNNLFSPRNSFAACASKEKIYIWGGLQITEQTQICLSDLIEIDVAKGRMRQLPLKEQIPIHSSAMLYDPDTDQLVAYGGTDQLNKTPAFLYRMTLKAGEIYEWQKINIQCVEHQGCVWQHSAHLTSKSFFTQKEGKYLTVIGGCKLPHSPFNCIVQIDIALLKVSNVSIMDRGLVSHDSVVVGDEIYIFGGATGGDFNQKMLIFKQGAITVQPGHSAIGCSCKSLENRILVYGGVKGHQSFSGMVMYRL